jgi:hypothetical protein
MLGVTLAEKKSLALHTVGAANETRQQTVERRRAERREYERERISAVVLSAVPLPAKTP